MKRAHSRASVLLACLLGGATANAVPVIYDFTGTGALSTYTGVGNAFNTSAPVEFSGWVSIEEIGVPSGDDSYINDLHGWAYDYSGWVQSDFFIDWGAGSFNPAVGSGIVQFDMLAQNGYEGLYDQLINREYYSSFNPLSGASQLSYAQLDRLTYDLSWLNDHASFDTSVGLATGPNAYNRITFENSSRTGGVGNYSGWFGSISLTSLTARSASVPEPGTLVLLGLALVGVAVTRRRRAS